MTGLITSLKGVGAKTAVYLSKLGIKTLEDLLFHFPLRYEDRTRCIVMSQLKPGDRVLIEGKVQHMAVSGRRRLQMWCRLHDATGSIILRFFHFNAGQLQTFKQPSIKLRCFGEVRVGLQDQLEMVHPEYEVIDEDRSGALTLEHRLTPVYGLTQGITQKAMRRLVKQALDFFEHVSLEELLPQAILAQYGFSSVVESLHYIHAPPVDANQLQLQSGNHPMQQRFIFEELLAHQLHLLRLRQYQNTLSAYPVELVQMNCEANLGREPVDFYLKNDFLRALSFKLTGAQERVIQEIFHDLSHARPMWRLLQGDVGSGKTLVAAMAAWHVIVQGYQVALMAPTEILAEQHYHTLSKWYSGLPVVVCLLTGSCMLKERQAQLQALKSGVTHIIVGTHALFQKDVVFHKLALVIIDEQHRFGVDQRAALQQKGIQNQYVPHQLIMTATPIPRTLSMTAYGYLDCSILDELPAGRQTIVTRLIAETRRQEVIARVAAWCRQGHQAYWVCPLIETSELLQCQAVSRLMQELQAHLTDITIDCLHGRMSTADKTDIMNRFKAGKIHLLVATTVIEVGVDVPNASVMIIENAERLGLSQLHQLRGRVGRGSMQSYCLLLYQAPLSPLAEKRLQVLRESVDGFYIAEADLALRGPGELTGICQSGFKSFKVADGVRDLHWLQATKTWADVLLSTAPGLAEKIIMRWRYDYPDVLQL